MRAHTNRSASSVCAHRGWYGLALPGVDLRPTHHSALRGFGVDSLPALIGALKVVDLEIKAFERGLPGKFDWFGMACHGVPSVRMASVPEAGQPNKDAAPDRGRAAVRARRVAARRGRGG